MTTGNVDSATAAAYSGRVTPPPYPTVATARREAGLDGIRALVAWIAAEHPPGVSSLTAAVLALGAAPDHARHAVDSLRRSARAAGCPLPAYPPGTPVGHPSHATRPHRSRKISANSRT